MTSKETSDCNHGSTVPLIAWLSTGLLTGGLGSMMDPSTQILWLRAGCFGLVAAVGLDVSARIRAKQKRIRHFRALQRRCDRSLEMFVSERDVADALRTATTHLLTVRPQKARENVSGEEARWACNLPVEVYALRREDSAEWPDGNTVGIAGRMINLSNSGFGMMLAEPLAARLVIITMLPPSEQEFDLLAEILWCDACPDGSTRVGGRLLRVLPASCRGSADDAHTDSEEMPAGAAR
ncbi:MAG TPA: hypothetical protein VHY91_15850 [Pirellulales bacterium]|nr:hypothetical protein [Pirellulales bacterium]